MKTCGGFAEKPLPEHIRAVAGQMDALSERMMAVESAAAAAHALELSGAANIARTWAEGMEKEAEGAEMTNKVKRPIARYHGGKWRLAPWIIKHFPKHRVYVEPFGGAASVLLRKERAYAEVYNDLDGEMVNLFRVARDQGAELERLLRLTPYAREELRISNEPNDDHLEQARRTVARSFMRFGYQRVTKASFRDNTTRPGSIPAHDWARFPDCFKAVVERLQGVVVENREAEEVMAKHDSPETLHYVDPPYVRETRGCHRYRYDMDDLEHVELCRFLRELKGFVVLSGYNNSLYADQLDDWLKVERRAFADGAGERTECLWLSPSTVQALKAEKGVLF